MRLSYVIVTHNRRDTLLHTLSLLPEHSRLPLNQWEAWVIDNASDDGTTEAVRHLYPNVHVVRLAKNIGMPARNYGFGRAQGEYVTMIDDDSYPIENAIPDSLAYLDANPTCGAVVGRALLKNGKPEASAFPSVMLGCATTMRRSVLDEVGGFHDEFFRQAEEYDLSFRFWQAGHSVDRFEDILFRHEKAPGGRSSEMVARYDLRNNLILCERYLPKSLRHAFRDDWTQRYMAIAKHNGHERAAKQGLVQAMGWRVRQALRGRQTLSDAALESVFGFESQLERITLWASRHNARRVAIADYGKNLYTTFLACEVANLEIVSIIDESPAYAGLTYRNLPVLPAAEAARASLDGVVLSNVNPAQIDTKIKSLEPLSHLSILRLWEPRFVQDQPGFAQTEEAQVLAA